MVLSLSTGHEIGLAVTGFVFVSFSLLSSFVFPRLWPDFPSRAGMRWYIPLTFCFFAAMLAAVLVFGQEQKTAAASSGQATGTTTSTSTGAASTTSTAPAGNAAAGKAVFMSAGCSACHTFKAAGSSGTIGPNLDQVASYASKANQPLPQFLLAAITHPPAPYVPPGFANVMPTTFGTSLSSTQLANLVAFLATSAGG